MGLEGEYRGWEVARRSQECSEQSRAGKGEGDGGVNGAEEEYRSWGLGGGQIAIRRRE